MTLTGVVSNAKKHLRQLFFEYQKKILQRQRKKPRMRRKRVRQKEDQISAKMKIVRVPRRYFSFMPDACNFKLNYSDITHLTFRKGIVETYFQNGSYLVQAKDCEQKVIEIINFQKSINCN